MKLVVLNLETKCLLLFLFPTRAEEGGGGLNLGGMSLIMFFTPSLTLSAYILKASESKAFLRSLIFLFDFMLNDHMILLFTWCFDPYKFWPAPSLSFFLSIVLVIFNLYTFFLMFHSLELYSFATYVYILSLNLFIVAIYIKSFMFGGFHEKGSLSYLCALRINR